MRSPTRKSNGFTVVELIGIIAIVAILATLAVSAYQTYTVRAQVTEAIDATGKVQSLIVGAFQSLGQPPGNGREAGLSTSDLAGGTRYLSQVDIVDGRIDITFGNQAHADIVGDTLSFTPYVSESGEIIWRCGNAARPGTNMNPLSGGGLTAKYREPTIEPRYLPSNCRR